MLNQKTSFEQFGRDSGEASSGQCVFRPILIRFVPFRFGLVWFGFAGWLEHSHYLGRWLAWNQLSGVPKQIWVNFVEIG